MVFGFSKEVVTFDKISAVPCLALLGEPGIGKSIALETEIENLKRKLVWGHDQQVLHFNLRSYGSESRLVENIFESEQFKQWQSGSQRLNLFLDSLDEGLLRIDTLSSLLIEKLKTLPIDRLNLRIACRTAEWPVSLEARLKSLWGDAAFKAYELAPLQMSDVSLAARAKGFDADEFLSEVDAKGGEPLAAKPVTLRLLLNLFRQHKSLPRTQSELYERGCLLLCEEESEGRKKKWELTARQRMRVAARIAAMTILSNKASIWIGTDTGEQNQSDLMVREISGGFESDSDGVVFHITEDAVHETLSAAGLFTSRGRNRLGWQHQTYAEFLTAWYLDHLSLKDDMVLGLLRSSNDADGLLVPQLYESAAWIASRRPQIFETLMQTEPLILLRSDVLAADDQVRADLVAALLKVFEDEKEFDRWEIRSYYSKLKHNHLADQLKPYIIDQSKSFLVRQVAIDIAEECKLRVLQNELVDIALDESEKPGTRANAAGAVSEIGDCEAKARLKPLALGLAGEDPESELKGFGLMAVWPNHLSAEELFNTLTDHPNLYGSYKSFLNRLLVPSLRTEDLPVALNWVKSVIKDNDAFDFDRKAIAAQIVLKAWDALDDQSVLNALVEVVLEKIKRYDELLEDLNARDALLAMRRDTRKRKRLLLQLLPLLDNRNDWFRLSHSLVLRFDSEDIPWFLDELRTNEDPHIRTIFISVLKDFLTSWHGVHSNVLTAIISAMEDSELIKNELAPFFEPVDLNSPTAKAQRDKYQETRLYLGREKVEPEDPPVVPAPAERVLAMLAKFEQGDVDGWWRLNLEMTLDGKSKFYGDEFQIDLTRLPGWISAPAEIRTRIINAARRYVFEGDPKTDKWIGTNTVYRPAYAGYRALWLLKSVDLVFINSLSTDVWRKWVPIIFHYPIFNGSGQEIYEAHRRFIGMVYQIVPDEIIKLILGEIDRLRTNTTVDLEKLHDCWDAALSEALRTKLFMNNLNPDMFRLLFMALVQHDDQQTISYAHELLTLPLSTEENLQQRAIVAATSLMVYAEDVGWSFVWPAILSNPEFGQKVFEAFSWRDRRNMVTRLSEVQLGAFYVWLSRYYPHSEDPEHPPGEAYAVGTREEIASLRDSLLSGLKERGTPAAVQSIEKIAGELPELEWLKWTLIEAKRSLLRHSWKPLLPNEILSLGDLSENAVSESNKVVIAKHNSSFMLWDQLVADIPNLPELIASFRFRPDKFAFFVGAGLSAPVFPGWDELLSRLISKCDGKKVLLPTDRDELLDLVNQRKDFLHVASTCVHALKPSDYRAFIEEQFDIDIDVSKLPAYQELFKLRPSTIVTTNFDQIPERLNGLSFSLDEHSTSSSVGHYRMYTNRSVPEANNAWKDGKPLVFKMHGCVTNHDSIIFTLEDFRREIHQGHVKEFLKAIFSSQTVIFLGFSFSDPHIDSILGFLYEANHGLASPHYVVSNDLTNIERQKLERTYGVNVINYSSSPGHPQVTDFLSFLRGN